jgi:hypothetical protein
MTIENMFLSQNLFVKDFMSESNLDSQSFDLFGKAFHRINQLPWAMEKTYSIVFRHFSAHLTMEQAILLSTSVYKHNQKYGKPFIIETPPRPISDQEVLDSFRSLLTLFTDVEEIEINSQNKAYFLFLSSQFDNSHLKDICLKVNFDIPQHFSFSSKRFRWVHQKTLSKLFDFTVYINHRPFHCDSVFTSCFSQTIFAVKCQNSSIQEIHFNNIDLDHILLSLFEILNGHSFSFSCSNINSLQSAISLIGLRSFPGNIESPTTFHEAIHFLSQPTFINFEEHFHHSCHLIAQNFSNLFEHNFSKLTTRAIERILSSEYLHLPTENFLFQTICPNPEKIHLMKFGYFQLLITNLYSNLFNN